MDIKDLPKTLDLKTVRALRNAFGAFYDQDEPSYTDPQTKIHFDKVTDFVDFLYSPEIGIPKGTSAKHIGITLERWYEILQSGKEGAVTMTGAPEYAAPSNTLTPEQLKQFREEEKVLSEKIKETRAESKEAVQAAIDKKIENAGAAKKALEKQEAYIKVQQEAAKLSEEQREKLNVLKEQVNADPVKAVDVIKDEIKSRVDSSIPDEAITLTATGIVANIQTNFGSATETAVAQEVKDKPEFSWESSYADQSKSLLEMQQEIAKTAFGDLQKTLLPDTKVEISDAPQPGFSPLPQSFLPERSLEILNSQRSILSDTNPDRAAYLQSWVQRELARIAERGSQGGFYDESLLRNSFLVFRKGPQANWEAIGGGPKLDMATGLAEPFRLITGLAKGAATKAVTKAVTGVVSKALAPETAGLSLIVGQVINLAQNLLSRFQTWLKENDLSEIFPALLASGVAFPFFGVPGSLGLGGATFLGLKAFNSTPAERAGFGRGIGNFFGALGGAILGAIGAPILFTLLGFPVIVALILFIINSGAYVVPPTFPESPFANGGISVVCSDEKGPVGVNGPSAKSAIANRAWEITYDLYQGFWCFWNRSPKAPPPNFPNDTLKYPPGYPNLFDYSLFKRNPNPPESSGPNLFWCTWLIVKAYQENGNNIKANLYVPDMYNDFNARGKIISADKATPSNIPPGSVVFFQVTTGEFSNRLNHVGVVYFVDPGGITLVESNGPLKSQTINFKPGGGTGNLPLMLVKYFGLP